MVHALFSREMLYVSSAARENVIDSASVAVGVPVPLYPLLTTDKEDPLT
jgi:hypothetical protein